MYAHGGGGVASTAALAKPWLDYIAVKCGVVVFNVDYRLAPETKSPNNVLDFYESLKYIYNNAASLNVDPGTWLHNHIAIFSDITIFIVFKVEIENLPEGKRHSVAWFDLCNNARITQER